MVPLTLFILMAFPMHVDRISLELPILYFKGSHVEIFKLCCISVMKICFYLYKQCRHASCCISSGSSLFVKAYVCRYPSPEVIKLFPCSTQLSTKFILLINVKMPTIVGILTFISIINTTFERLKARNFFICRYFSFSFYEQMKFRAQLS